MEIIHVFLIGVVALLLGLYSVLSKPCKFAEGTSQAEFGKEFGKFLICLGFFCIVGSISAQIVS